MHYPKNDHSGCRRCGTCCKDNSPALHLIDLPLIKDQHILKNQLITYRKGEWLKNNVEDTFVCIEQDIVKPIAKQNGCIFFDVEASACQIYENRPIECRLQICDAPELLQEMYEKDRITRRDIISKESPFTELICYHEEKCSLNFLENISPKSTYTLSEKTRVKILSMIQFEYHFRSTLYERVGLQTSDMDFLFGRSVEIITRQMGFSFEDDRSHNK